MRGNASLLRRSAQCSVDSRAFLTASYRSLLRTYILSPPNEPPPDALIKLLSSPRIRHVDLCYLDDSSGRTLLHEAARRKDLRLIELAVRAGADVFVRDRKGRTVSESAGKDERVKVFLKQCQSQICVRYILRSRLPQSPTRTRLFWQSRQRSHPSCEDTSINIPTWRRVTTRAGSSLRMESFPVITSRPSLCVTADPGLQIIVTKKTRTSRVADRSR